MADGYLLGRQALEQVARLIREDRARYANPAGHRGRWQDHTPPKPAEEGSSGSDSGSGSASGDLSGSSGSGSGTGTGGTGTGDTGSGSITGGTGSGPSGSGGSGSSGSGSSGTGGTGGTGSGKDTAIVPASWSAKGYAALFVEECPEVRFDDVVVVTLRQKNATVAIDPKYVEVCEPDSIEVCGWSVNRPVLLGAIVSGVTVAIEFAERCPDRELRVVLRLTGIRKGFAGMRFPERSKAQFESNERFIRSAYKHEE